MPHPFLSDEWLADARAIREKYAGQGAPIGHKVKMNQIITDTPFGDGDIELYMDTTSGEVRLEKGHLDDADVTVTTDYETARKIFVDQDPQAGMQAFMSGKIKVQGDMMKLMQMQGAAPDDTARKVADEIKAITE
ncbi:MAG TPA: SCP2 sterol-binding domain-containing protein [Acidimicrobiales bacterium]|nr:SCP2 sterol-binding domain-containing protein [Acidimicrobiales bacterium]